MPHTCPTCPRTDFHRHCRHCGAMSSSHDNMCFKCKKPRPHGALLSAEEARATAADLDDTGPPDLPRLLFLEAKERASKQATIDKDLSVGDPAFVEVPVERLTGAAHATAAAGRIKEHVKASVPRFNAGMPSKDTTQVSVVDADGCRSVHQRFGVSGLLAVADGQRHHDGR